MVWPTAVILLISAVFTSVIAGATGAGIVTSEGGDTVLGPLGGSPATVALFVIDPASTSAWVSV